MLITNNTYLGQYFDDRNYEDANQLRHELLQLERSRYNTEREIYVYEGLNAKQDVKTYHISELKK